MIMAYSILTRRQHGIREREQKKKSNECIRCPNKIDRKGSLCKSCVDKEKERYKKRRKAGKYWKTVQ